MFPPSVHRFVLSIVFIVLSITGILGEKIPVNNQTGWDGKHYAQLAIHFEELAQAKQIDAYQYQRILTPLAIHYVCKLIGHPLSEGNIVFTFAVFNFISMMISVILFWRICNHLNLTIAAESIGFSALFLNYFALKLTWYYPVLTDVTAFTFGMLFCYLYITKQKAKLLLASIVSIITFPLLFIISLPLVLYKRDASFTKWLQSVHFFKILPWLIGLVLIIVTTGIYLFPSMLLPKYTMQRNIFLVPISLALSIGALVKMFQGIQTSIIERNINLGLKKSLIPLSVLIGSFIAINIWIARNSIPEDVFTLKVFALNLIQQAIDNPFAPLVAHITYIGPALVLIIFFFKTFINHIIALGDSAVVYFCLILLLLILGSETRQFIHVFPFLVIVLMQTVNTRNYSPFQVISFVVLSLVMSKCWLPINVEDIFSKYDYGNFPDQYYFMNQGPFCSDLGYLINVVSILFSIICLWRLKFFTSTDTPT